MKLIAALLVAASGVLAQKAGSAQSPSLSTGNTALGKTSTNNDIQTENSVISIGSHGGSLMTNINGASFLEGISNSILADNSIVNPSRSDVKGNIGVTANGDSNRIGDLANGGVGLLRFPGFATFHKRDVPLGSFGGHVVGVLPIVGYPFGGFPIASIHPAILPVLISNPVALPNPAPVVGRVDSGIQVNPGVQVNPGIQVSPGVQANPSVQTDSLSHNHIFW
ncbi:hypothetical protein GGI12_002742 [Dipsacomyces acuminosporus]|nr:hypothetical protein GGI12_002742 [Dipsacomyces acuminosporus]